MIPKILVLCIMLFSLSLASSEEIDTLQKKYFMNDKFALHDIFQPYSITNPDNERTLVMIILKIGCKHSQLFKRKVGELIRTMEQLERTTNIELKFFNCPFDDTCFKIFGSKSYPEIRFYSTRKAPKLFFVRYTALSEITIENTIKWMMKRHYLQDNRLDMFNFDKIKSNEIASDKTTKMVADKGLSDQFSSKLVRKMRKIGFYYSALENFRTLEFWKLLGNKIIQKEKELLILFGPSKMTTPLLAQQMTRRWGSDRMCQMTYQYSK